MGWQISAAVGLVNNRRQTSGPMYTPSPGLRQLGGIRSPQEQARTMLRMEQIGGAIERAREECFGPNAPVPQAAEVIHAYFKLREDTKCDTFEQLRCGRNGKHKCRKAGAGGGDGDDSEDDEAEEAEEADERIAAPPPLLSLFYARYFKLYVIKDLKT